MLEIIAIAVAGTIIAGLWDLKTTEVPDHLPYAMIGIGIVYWIVNAVSTGVYTTLMISLLVGSVLLALGLIMYRFGQWGGADAWILAAVGYMVPVYDGMIFIVPYIMNFAVVALAYTVVYSLAIGFLKPGLFAIFAKDLRKKIWIVALPAAALIGSLLAFYATSSPVALAAIVIAGFASFIALFYVYAKTVESNYFIRKIPVSKLRKGDVLKEGNWVGITESDIARIRSKHRFVTIKDGVRFVPVFAIALVATLLYGDLLSAILKGFLMMML